MIRSLCRHETEDRSRRLDPKDLLGCHPARAEEALVLETRFGCSAECHVANPVEVGRCERVTLGERVVARHHPHQFVIEQVDGAACRGGTHNRRDDHMGGTALQ